MIRKNTHTHTRPFRSEVVQANSRRANVMDEFDDFDEPPPVPGGRVAPL